MTTVVRNPMFWNHAQVKTLLCCGLQEYHGIELPPETILAFLAHKRFHVSGSYTSSGGYLFTDSLTRREVQPDDPREDAYLRRKQWEGSGLDTLRRFLVEDHPEFGPFTCIVPELYNYNENHLVTVWLWDVSKAKYLAAWKNWYLQEVAYEPYTLDLLRWKGSGFATVKQAGHWPQEIRVVDLMKELENERSAVTG